jgi:hypothetical protein
MSSTNLLNTATINFQDLIGNGKSYKVPPYQRDYSWTEEQWEDLWSDILELRPDPKKRHYMGAVVVKADSDRQFLIIDGQQRIATLTILGLAVIKHLLALAENSGGVQNKERAKELRSRYIGEKDPASLTEISKLVLNDHDNGFFQDYLVQLRRPLNPRSLPKSNRLLWDCFSYFEKQINNDPVFSSDGLVLAQLLSEVVARRLMFILITVDDEISAYTVFETLNARGLELTTTDLLKNYLFSRLQATSDLEAAQRRWQRLVRTVRQERFGEFLRYHYLTRYKHIRTGRLFKIVREEIQSSADVLALISALEARAELFDALGDPSHAFWVDQPDAKPHIRELTLFNVRQMTPLIFAAFEMFSSQEFVKVLKCVAAISFRYTIISGLNPNELEPVYHEAAKAVLDGKSKTAKSVFDSLRSIYVSDEKFLSDFAQCQISTGGRRKKIAKYILCRLESDASGKPCDFETEPGTIEHVLPENPMDSWDELIARDRWEEAIYRLGNLTLLKSSVNRESGNRSYAEKTPSYRASEYAMTRSIPEIAPEEWTLPLLEKRQASMAARARQLWRVDFA